MPFADNPAEPQRPALSRAAALLMTIAILWCIYWFVHAWHYWEDDAYIHLEFARSLASGRGFAFDGSVVSGDTAPLWVFLLVATHALLPGWLIAGKVLTALGAVLGIAGIYAFARRLSSSLKLPNPDAQVFPAAMVLLIVFNPYSCYWLFSGMEPIAAVGLGFFAALAATREPPTTATFLTGCLLAGIAPLLRPEMLFLTVLLVLPLFGQWRRTSTAKLATFAAGLVLLCAPVALWSLYSLHAFGHLLPNTNAAKRAAPDQSVAGHLISIYSFGFPLIVCGLLAGIVYLALRPSAVRRSLQSAFASALRTAPTQPSDSLPLTGWLFLLWPLIATVFYIVNHTYVQTRYILVTAPGLTIVILLLTLRISRRTGRVVYLAGLVLALACSVCITRPFIRNKGMNCQAVHNLALFMRDHIPPDAPVATYSIGQIAFDSEHPIVDTGGITRPGAIPYLNSSHGDMLRWARSQGAQYEIWSQSPEPGASSVYTVRVPFIGWTIHTSLYATSSPVALWKLPPLSGPALRTEELTATHP